MLNITEVRIHLLGREDTNLRAYATITIDHSFVVHGIKIIEAERGVFVGMPRRRRDDGSSQDVAHPIDNRTRIYVEDRILAAYHQELARSGSSRGTQPIMGDGDGPDEGETAYI